MKKKPYKPGPRTTIKAITKVAQSEAVALGRPDVDPNDLLQQIVNGKVEGIDIDLISMLDVRIEAAKVLMPYRHKKKPVDINQTTTARFVGIDINVPGLPKA